MSTSASSSTSSSSSSFAEDKELNNEIDEVINVEHSSSQLNQAQNRGNLCEYEAFNSEEKDKIKVEDNVESNDRSKHFNRSLNNSSTSELRESIHRKKHNVSNTHSKTDSANKPSPDLPRILSIQMPAFERNFRNKVLLPLTSPNSSQKLGNDSINSSNDSLQEAAKVLRCLMRCVYSMAVDFTSSNTQTSINKSGATDTSSTSFSEWGRFSDKIAEQTFRQNLLPYTIHSLLMLRGDDISIRASNNHFTSNESSVSSSSSQRKTSLLFSSREENIYFTLLLDFVELSANMLKLNGNIDLNLPEYLGREWLISLCKIFGDLHYWEYTDDDWRGLDVSIDGSSRNGCALPCFYQHYGHNRVDCCAQKCDVNEVSTMISSFSDDDIIFTRVPLLSSSTIPDDRELSDALKQNEQKKDTIIVSLMHDDLPMSVSFYLLAMTQYFIQQNGLYTLGTMVCDNQIIPNNISETLEDRPITHTTNDKKRVSLASLCSIINIVRAIVSVSWINASSSMDSETLNQISRFRDIVYRHISMLRVGYDIVSGVDRQILFSLLDSFCNSTNQLPQNNVMGGLLLDSNISMQLRLDSIWKMLCGENTTLQSRIFGLNEMRNRITDAVQDLDTAKSRAEELFLYEQEKISMNEKKKQNSFSPCIINDDHIKPKSFPRLDITGASPINSISDNVSTTAYAHSSCGDDGESSHDDDQHRIDFEENEEWMKRRIDRDNLDESMNTYIKDSRNSNDNLKDSNSQSALTCKDRHNNHDLPSFNYNILDSAKQEVDRLILFLIEDHSFLSTLLSPSYLHPELLKRFIIIPSFLAEQNALTSNDIEIIWNAAKTSSHESIQHAVYELVIGLIDKLERQELITLGELLSSVPYELVTDKYLLLVHNFAMASLGVLKNVDGKDIPLGVDLLWDLVQETVPLRKGLHQTVISYILNIGNKTSSMCNNLDYQQTSYRSNKLTEPEFSSAINTTKMWLLENAVDGIKHGKSSIPCQLIINNMLRFWSGQEETNLKRKRKSFSKTVDCVGNSQIPNGSTNENSITSSASLESRFAIIKKYDLVSLVINDLCQYMNHFKDFVHRIPKLSNEEIDGFIPRGGFYSHAVSLSSRLEFLKFVLGISFNALIENQCSHCSSNGSIFGVEKKNEEDNPSKSRRKINIEDIVEEKDPVLKLPNTFKGVVEPIDLSDDNSQHGKDNSEIVSMKEKLDNRDLRDCRCIPMNPIVIEDDDDDDYLDYSNRKSDIEDTNKISIYDSPQAQQKPFEKKLSMDEEKRDLGVNTFEDFKAKKKNTKTESLNECILLTSNHIELLWSNLVENSNTPQESDLCLSALHSILATSEYCLSIRTYFAPILFDYCLSRLPVEPMTPPAFDLLALSMTCCNLIHGRYELFVPETSTNQKAESIATNILLGHLMSKSTLLTSEGSIQVRIVSFDILGTDKLWEIALTAKDEDVAKKAMLLLSTLYTFESISDKLKQNVAAQQRRFVQSCMSALNGGRDHSEPMTISKNHLNHVAAKNKRKGEYIIRCLRLISTYADAIMRHALNAGVIPGANHDETICTTLPSVSHGYSTSEQIQKFTSGVLNYFHVRVQPSYGLPSFEVKCSIGATVSYLRKAVLDRVIDFANPVASADSVTFNVPQKNGSSAEESSVPLCIKSAIKGSTDYRLIYRGKELTKENMLLTSSGISDGAVIHCWPRLNTKGIFSSQSRNVNSHKTTVIDVEETSQFVGKKKRCFVDKSPRNNSEAQFGHDEQRHDEKISDMGNIWKHPIMAAIAELVKSHHISVFFDLLSEKFLRADKQMREIVWQLLQLLPTDPELKMELMSLVPVSCNGGKKKTLSDNSFIQIFPNHYSHYCNWEKLLPPIMDPGKSFNLLYALQVVQSLTVEVADLKATSSKKTKLSEVDAENNTKTLLYIDDRNASWKKKFFCRGGVAHLMNILLNIDTSTKGPFDFEKWSKGDHRNKHYEEYLVSTNLLFLLRCIHRLQQLLIFFLKELKSAQSDFMNDIIETSGFGLLISHILQTLHFSVSILNKAWNYQQNSDAPTLNLNDEKINSNFPPYNTIHSTYVRDSRLSMHNDDTSFESSNLINPALSSKEPLAHSANEICTEAICISQYSLSLLELILLNVHCASFVNKLFNSSNGIDSNDLLSSAIASTLVVCPSIKVRKFGLNTFRSIFDAISNNNKSGKELKNRLTSKILSIVIRLLLMGQKADLIERFNDVFLLIRDLLNNIWKNTSDIDKEKFIAIVEDEVSKIAINISITISSENTEVNTSLPDFTDIGCMGKLLNWVCVAIVTTPIREQRRKTHPIDSFLVGLLKLADQIIQMSGNKVKENFGKYASVFIHHIFYDCLFSLPSANNNGPISAPKCKTIESRNAALNLLKTLSKGCPDNLIAIHRQLLAAHHTSIPRQNLAYEWHFDPISRDKGSTGHVGLRNLGATCYLNSLLQQLFFIKPFRYGVLSCKTNKENDSNTKGYDLLYELQLLFANLLLSERKDYDTSELCLSINDYDGNPIRPGEQQDVVEFFNLFGDRLENVLKSFDQRYLLQDVFGGELCHIIICQECKHRSQHSEDCLSLSLDVKGKSNIYESLKLYIQGEVLDGDNKYYCEKCQAKRDSLKMCCVSRLPNNLILHLKRFEFDLESMRKIKVNDRFEYPLEIDMYPYTKEGKSSAEHGTNPLSVNSYDYETKSDASGYCKPRPDGYYQYFLRGVLVHSGTADSGHYYSLARDSSYGLEEHAGENLADGSRGLNKQQWFCFNDSCVTPFDLSSLPSATFGGTKIGSKYDHTTHKMVQTESSKPYSAYLLIYERNHIEFKPRGTDSISTKNIVKGMNENKISPWLPKSNKTDADLFNTVQMEIFKELWDSNDCFLRDQVMFSPEYCKWLIGISKTINVRGTLKNETLLTLQMTKVMTHFLFETLIHGKDTRNYSNQVISILCSSYAESEDACRWILLEMSNKYKYWAEKILLHCPIVEVRANVVTLLTVIFRKMRSHERKLYCIENYDEVKPANRLDQETDDNSCDTDEEQIFDADDDLLEVPTEADDKTLKSNNLVRLGRIRWWKSKSILAQFVGSVTLDILPHCEQHWRRFDQLFEVIFIFASLGQEESIYLIRCGLLLRLLDIYLGDSGGVPKKSLVGKQSLQSRQANTCRARMGDKYTKPNMSPLLHTLDLLIRSAVAIPDDNDDDDDDDVEFDDDDDDDDSIESKVHATSTKASSKVDIKSKVSVIDLPQTLKPSALVSMTSSSTRLELPRRDLALILTKKFFQTLLEESSLNVKNMEQSTPCSCPSPSSGINCLCLQRSICPKASVLKNIVCHLSFNNIDCTRLICEISGRMFEDRKADEFLLALEALLSLVQMNDAYVDTRIEVVMSALITGINCNLKYEKESIAIIKGLTSVLKNRTKGVSGTMAEASLHKWIMECIESEPLEWFRRQNTTGEVRHCIISLLQSLLPVDQETVTASDEYQKKKIESPNSHRDDVNTTGKDDRSRSISFAPKTKVDDDVIVIGIVKNKDLRLGNEAESTRTDWKQATDNSLMQSYSDKSRGRQYSSFFPYLPGRLIKKRLFFSLINIFDIVSKAIRTQASRNSAKFQNRNTQPNSSMHDSVNHNASNKFIDSSILAVYFETLGSCLTGDDYEKGLLLQRYGGINERLASLLWEIDEEGRAEHRPSADIVKGEIIKLYKKMIKLHSNIGEEIATSFSLPMELPIDVDSMEKSDIDKRDQRENSQLSDEEMLKRNKKLGKRLIDFTNESNSNENNKKHKEARIEEIEDYRESKVDSVSKLLEIYVTSLRENVSYNVKYMSHYYSLLLLIADGHTAFRKKMLCHNNWRWALRAFVIANNGQDYNELTQIIFDGTMNFIRDKEFRTLLVTELSAETYEGGKKSFLTQVGLETFCLRLLRAIIECGDWNRGDETIISSFVDDHNGIRQLSVSINKYHKALENKDKSNPTLHTLLEGLSLSLECMFSILDVIGLNRIRALLSKWAEADDTNFLCCQLVTRSTKEWENFLEKDNQEICRSETLRIIEYASGILTVLASVETAAIAE